MAGPIAEFVRRRGQLPPAPKAEEDWRDAQVRRVLDQQRAFSVQFGQGYVDEAVRMDREVLTPGYQAAEQRFKELRHRVQTSPASRLHQPEVRRDREAIVRERIRLDRLAESAKLMAAKGEQILADPEGHQDALLVRYGLEMGRLPW